MFADQSRPSEESSANAESPADPTGSVRQLRLALVCYGGVSLAIYMHGITKEIHKLVVASKGLEVSPDRNPFRAGTERVYWDALKELRDREGIATRVVVDILAGSSAGGINAVFLAKALAHNRSQDALRDVWLENGDLRKLLRSRLPGIPLKVTGWAITNLFRKGTTPPLNGDLMLTWLWEALNRMDAEQDPSPFPGLATLMPEDHELNLFVTTTDLSGYMRLATAHAPKQVQDLWHRHVLPFRFGDGRDQLDERHNAALAFAARATSCFPGAFPPVNVENVTEVLRPQGWPGDFPDRFARIYGLSRIDVSKRHFIDGGVLDNRPFQVAIEAVVAKPAETEVDRRLLYIEPDPYAPAPAAEGTPAEAEIPAVPGMIQTVWRGLSTIPRNEPILSDLLRIRGHNQSIDEMEGIVDAAYEDVERAVDAHPAPPPGDWTAYDEVNGQISREAAEIAGPANLAYFHLKLRSVLDRLARVAAEICNFPQDSNHWAFVRDVVYRWADDRTLLGRQGSPTPEQIDFLRAFDLGFRERRVRFVIKGLNELYRTVDQRTEPPLRADLDEAKKALWGFIVRLRRLSRRVTAPGDESGAASRVRALVTEAFDEDAISEELASTTTQDMAEATARFAERRRAGLDRAAKELEAYLTEELASFSQDLYAAFQERTSGWDQRIKDELVVRYLGFPYWDILIYPLLHVTRLGELNRVEVIRMSPNDVDLLSPKGAKAKLKGVTKGHFGAFFEREYRENDYLWGRLDAAERLLWILFDRETVEQYAELAVPGHAATAFRAILDEERPAMTSVDKLLESLDAQIATGQD
jgi:patatin-related protein